MDCQPSVRGQTIATHCRAISPDYRSVIITGFSKITILVSSQREATELPRPSSPKGMDGYIDSLNRQPQYSDIVILGVGTNIIDDPPAVDAPQTLPSEVPLDEWKAWGYYACPTVDGLEVRNHRQSIALFYV